MYGIDIQEHRRHLWTSRLLPVQRLLVTDSVTTPTESAFSLQVTSLDTLLAEAIRHLHGQLSLGHLLVHE
jgi:hypothetical protein